MIELLIVVAIISILAAIAVPNFLNAMIRSKIARSQSDMHSLGIAIESFRADRNEMLVDDSDEWTAVGLARLKRWGFCSPDNLVARNQKCIMGNLTSPVSYISAIPNDPFFAQIANTENPILIDTLAGTYFYGDNDPALEDQDITCFYLNANAIRPPGMQPLLEGQWALLGIGPGDAEKVVAINLFFRGLPYDTTNGLISGGDIIVRGG